MRKYTSWQSSWAPKSLQTVTAAMKLKMLAPWEKSYDKPRQHIKKQRHYFADKGPYSQSYGFLVVMYRCESGTIKTAKCWKSMFWSCGAGEDSWESLGLQGDQTSQS